ncbi:putative metal-dependent hydrolase [Parageobacillus sp. VR-IP]|uniref:YfiT family bacillithiol transferase n=1 Tax=Parageobacillus sp. VR-IP TaxID=2742205 RepID=UPI0015831EC9|nr:putative metal-dependent hydrolase [Parageobacillus sp. VR-IP]NUK28615.1 putative metal-dependent hydrolase [Parageobacillus sp. VR-IP]
MDDIRYPIGKFKAPEAFRKEDVGRWIADIRQTPGALREAVRGLSEEQLNTPYRDGGWTVIQVVHHIADASMNAFLRTKWILTEDTPAIKPFEESEWAKTIEARSLPIEPSLKLLEGLHERWASLLEALDEEDFQRTFYHEGTKETAFLYVLTALYAWHGKHHTAQITALRERKGWK